jgi:hypothetical protein
MEGVSERDYQRAKKRVEEIRGFQVFLIVYIVVNIMLFLIDLFTSPGVWWFYWPLGGMSIGLFWYAMSVFVFGKPHSKKWEEAKIKEVLDKDKE